MSPKIFKGKRYRFTIHFRPRIVFDTEVKVNLAHTQAWSKIILKHPLIIVKYSWKLENCGYNTARVRGRAGMKKSSTNGCGGHLVFQNKAKNLKPKALG